MDFIQLKQHLDKFIGAKAAVNSRQCAFRAIQHSSGSYPVNPAEALYESFSSDDSGRNLLLRCTSSDVQVVDSNNIDVPEKNIINDLRTWLAGSILTTFYIDDFQVLCLLEQQKLLATLRGLREEGLKIRLLLAGKWPYYAFRKTWIDASNTDKPLGSFPFDQVLSLNGYSRQVLTNLLLKYGVDSSLKEYYSDHLWRMTRGDQDLVSVVEDKICSSAGESPERLFDRLDDISTLHDIVLERCYDLHQRPKEILSAVLRYQRVRLPYDDTDAEDLYLRGLLRKSDENAIGDRTVWEISSPTMTFSLLRHWRVDGNNSFVHTRELLPPLQSAASEAYEIMCHIENLLRNTLCLTIGWLVDQDLTTELLRLFPKEQQANTAQRLNRDEKEYDISLRQTLTSYLDLEALCTALRSDSAQEMGINKIFPDANKLNVEFVTFARIRTHIAHGRPVSSKILSELCRLREWFECSLAQAASNELVGIELSRFPVTIIEARIVKKALLVGLKNNADKSLPIGTKIFIEILGKWRSKPVTINIAAGQERTVHFDDFEKAAIDKVDVDDISFGLCC